LAAALGDEVYIDIAKWHLYLKDAKLHILLAEHLAPLVLSEPIDEAATTEILNQIPVKLAGGRKELPLLDLLPMQSILNLLDVLEKIGKEWRK
jgi:hypothetical protein